MQVARVQPSSTMMPTNTWLKWWKHGLPTRIHPWLAGVKVGDIHAIPVSHGEGKFVVTAEEFAELRDNGQIFTQYVDFEGKPSMDSKYNPNGSVNAIEGITSKNGQIIGKMGHSERFEDGLFQNIPGNKDQHLFASAVKYFTGK